MKIPLPRTELTSESPLGPASSSTTAKHMPLNRTFEICQITVAFYAFIGGTVSYCLNSFELCELLDKLCPVCGLVPVVRVNFRVYKRDMDTPRQDF